MLYVTVTLSDVNVIIRLSGESRFLLYFVFGFVSKTLYIVHALTGKGRFFFTLVTGYMCLLVFRFLRSVILVQRI